MNRRTTNTNIIDLVFDPNNTSNNNFNNNDLSFKESGNEFCNNYESETIGLCMMNKFISLAITESNRRDIELIIPERCNLLCFEFINTLLKIQHIQRDYIHSKINDKTVFYDLFSKDTSENIINVKHFAYKDSIDCSIKDINSLKKNHYNNDGNILTDIEAYKLIDNEALLSNNVKFKTETFKKKSSITEENKVSNCNNKMDLESLVNNQDLYNYKINEYYDSWSPIKQPSRNKIDTCASTFIKDYSKCETSYNKNKINSNKKQHKVNNNKKIVNNKEKYVNFLNLKNPTNQQDKTDTEKLHNNDINYNLINSQKSSKNVENIISYSNKLLSPHKESSNNSVSDLKKCILQSNMSSTKLNNSKSLLYQKKEKSSKRLQGVYEYIDEDDNNIYSKQEKEDPVANKFREELKLKEKKREEELKTLIFNDKNRKEVKKEKVKEIDGKKITFDYQGNPINIKNLNCEKLPEEFLNYTTADKDYNQANQKEDLSNIVLGTNVGFKIPKNDKNNIKNKFLNIQSDMNDINDKTVKNETLKSKQKLKDKNNNDINDKTKNSHFFSEFNEVVYHGNKNNIFLKRDNKSAYDTKLNQNAYQPAGSNYDFIIPTTGVKIKEGTKSKKGDLSFKEKYGKYSKKDYDELLESNLNANSYSVIFNKASNNKNNNKNSYLNANTIENSTSVLNQNNSVLNNFKYKNDNLIFDNLSDKKDSIKPNQNLKSSVKEYIISLDNATNNFDSNKNYINEDIIKSIEYLNFKKEKHNNIDKYIKTEDNTIEKNKVDKFSKEIFKNKDWGNNDYKDIYNKKSIKKPLLNSYFHNFQNKLKSYEENNLKYRSIFKDTAKKSLYSSVDYRLLKMNKL